MTGPVIVDDVIYENVDDDVISLFPSKELIFRRLTFERSMGLVQSEALLTGEGCKNTVNEKEQKKSRSSKSKKRGNQKGNSSNVSPINGNVSRSSVMYVCSCKLCHWVEDSTLFPGWFFISVNGGCIYLFLSCI